ncbi:SDR family NAD(P)-dependent oxidoreductase [Gordonia humi]|uniref:SDR family NAD(P)-dependent oxidoreductase n=1 Tax=Gordonia humi TaxID=686429 RepID=UPI001C854F00
MCRLLNTSLSSTVLGSRAAMPHLVAGRGSIVNVGSINGRIPATGPVGYSAAKAALIAFTASPRSVGMTGSDLTIDAGATKTA